jgi:periplasmic copper chaperone A
MSIKRFTMRAGIVAVAAGVATLFSAGLASAHVTANILGETAAKGGYTKITFRVPNEDPAAGTIKLEVKFPAEFPLSGARTKPMPGWTGVVTKAPLAKPIKVNDAEVKEAVTSVVWTATGTRIAPGEFQEFELSVGPLPDNTDELMMPAIQTYDNGKVVAWDQPTKEGEEEPEYPAPVIALAAAGEGDHHHGGAAEEEPAPANAAMEADTHDEAAASTTDTTARWLGGAGLVVGALGVGFGVGATMRARRATAARGEQS